jgi:hypothetical protein
MKTRAGHSTRVLEYKRYSLRMGLGLVCLLLMWACISKLQGMTTIVGVVAVFGLVKIIDVAGNAWISKLSHLEKRAGRGAVGEEKVGAILDALDPALYQVFHDVPCPRGNIDHVVLTRKGAVFVIETKSHPGRVTADGKTLLHNGQPFEKDFINQTLSNALWLGGQLKSFADQEVWVTGVLCFSRGYVDIRGPIQGIRVTYAKNLISTLDRARTIDHLADWMWEHFPVLLQNSRSRAHAPHDS